MVAMAPFLAESVAGVSVRFYSSPSGRYELPWCSFQDLAAAARLPFAARDEMLGKVRPYADIGIVSLFEGGTTIVSHVAAIALIHVMTQSGAVQQIFADEYNAAVGRVLGELHAGLTDAEVTERLRGMSRGTYGIELADLVAAR